MSIKGQGHSLTLVKGHSDFKVKCLTFGLYNQVSDSGPQGPLLQREHTVCGYFGLSEQILSFQNRPHLQELHPEKRARVHARVRVCLFKPNLSDHSLKHGVNESIA